MKFFVLAVAGVFVLVTGCRAPDASAPSSENNAIQDAATAGMDDCPGTDAAHRAVFITVDYPFVGDPSAEVTQGACSLTQ